MVLGGIVGILAGGLARFLIPDGAATGMAGDTLIGLLGGLAGGFTYHLFGHKPPDYDFDGMSIVCAAAGAFALLLVVRAGSGRRTVS